MRLIRALIASTLLAVLVPGCNTEPPYNTLAETPPGGDPPIKRPIPSKKARKPKPPITETRRKVEVDGATPTTK